jgi:hypothetical protein
MGQARLKGTRDERVEAAKDAAYRAEMHMLAARQQRWNAMTQEQRNAALARAKREASNYGQLEEIFGHDVAMALAPIM